MSNPMTLAGAFSWNELQTHDVETARTFYSELLGWRITENQLDGMSYHLAKAGDTEVAGIIALPDEAKDMPSSWGGYITVKDVDATLEQAKRLGAEVCFGPQDCETLGRFAMIKDPTSAMVSFIAYSESYLANI